MVDDNLNYNLPKLLSGMAEKQETKLDDIYAKPNMTQKVKSDDVYDNVEMSQKVKSDDVYDNVEMSQKVKSDEVYNNVDMTQKVNMEDIYAKPDKTQKVKSDGVQKEERMMDIYINADTFKVHEPCSEAKKPTPENPAGDQLSSAGGPDKNLSRTGAVCLGLLCAFLLAGIIGLGVIFTRVNEDKTIKTMERDQLKTSNTILTRERDQLNTSYTNLTKERDQLRASYTNLTRERDQLNTSYTNLTRERDQLNNSYTNLTMERDQLKTSNTILTRERDQLQASYTNLTRERDQLNTRYTNLTKERDDIKRRLCVITSCPFGWLKFGCSCYYISTAVKKSWTDSKQDCSNRDADLVIINSPEEQEFLNNLTRERQINREMRVWIGLTDAGKEGTFIWVDGTPLATPKYWHYPNPDNYLYPDRPADDEDCVELIYMPAYVTPPLTWNDWLCDKMSNWVCEKEI